MGLGTERQLGTFRGHTRRPWGKGVPAHNVRSFQKLAANLAGASQQPSHTQGWQKVLARQKASPSLDCAISRQQGGSRVSLGRTHEAGTD